jgi:DNA-binding GntR family transcriptional regulator
MTHSLPMPVAKPKKKTIAPASDALDQILPKVPLGEQAYIIIKKMILDMDLRPGDYISVALLSKRLSLGRSPVHIALHRLDREGLVEILPRKGILVKAETANGFVELVSARLLIEPYLTGLAAERADDELIADLEKLIVAGRKFFRAKDRQGGMHIDRLFHQRIYEASGNKTLTDFAALLLDRSIRLWFIPMFETSIENANITQLEDLCETIKRRDKEGAISKMQAHIGAIRKKFSMLGM